MDRLDESVPSIDLYWEWLRKGWHYRGMHKLPKKIRKENTDRVHHESEMIIDKDFVDYFLMLSDAVRACKDNGIPVGPARGSAAASLVCYLLRITEVNPMHYPLMLFSRFVDPNRFDLPDVDLDFDDDLRDYVRQHLITRYGVDRVGNIGTFTRYRGKNAIDDVARVYQIPKYDIAQVKDLLVTRSGGDSRFDASIQDTLEMFPQAKEVFDRHPRLYESLKLEGNYKGFGVHAAGLVVGATALVDSVATYVKHDVGKNKNTLAVLSVDKYDGESLGMLKLDALSLSTMGMIRLAIGTIGMSLEELYAVPMDDAPTLAAFHKGDVKGIFQFDGRTMKMVCEQLKPDVFMDLAAVNALSRPGPLHSGSTGDYIAIRSGEIERESLHPLVDAITEMTEGQIIYQEQILQICREVGKFPWVHAAAIRKIISQKKGEAAFESMWMDFKAGASSQNISEELSRRIWNRMVTAGTYAFCCTGETIVKTGGRGSHGGKEYALRDLWEAYNSKTSLGDKLRYGQNGKRITLQQFDDDGRIRPAQFLSIKRSDVKMPVYRVELENGNSFNATLMHRILTTDGYQEIGDLVAGGTSIICCGEREGQIRSTTSQKYRSHGGHMQGEGNPAYVDGRSMHLKDAQKQVAHRSGGCCERCGTSGDGKSHSLEFAHMLSLEFKQGDYSLYHNANNILHLCNSCHKKFDYEKGERVSRHTVGLPSESSVVNRVVKMKNLQWVYMLEMNDANHNYVANGVVHHNNVAHCVSYSMLGFWAMWLKVHHPLAFYAAQLQKVKEERQLELMRDMQDERFGRSFPVLPPDPNLSGLTWAIDPSGRGVIAGFTQIPGIGLRTAEAIIEERTGNGDFGSWADIGCVKGVGPTTITKITAFCNAEDPFDILKIKNQTARIKQWLSMGLQGIPMPDTVSDTVPYDNKKSYHVIMGIVNHRNYQDMFEDHRARYGEELNVDDVKDPHLKDSMTMFMEDETGPISVKVNRWTYPKYKADLWGVIIGHHYIVAKVVKNAFYGKNVSVQELWVIDPCDDKCTAYKETEATD